MPSSMSEGIQEIVVMLRSILIWAPRSQVCVTASCAATIVRARALTGIRRCGCHPQRTQAHALAPRPVVVLNQHMGAITVFVADDSVFIREGVKAMLSRQHDLEIIGEAEDHDGLVAGAEAAAPNVVVSDIRMPPNFHREGIEACKLIRKRHPGTGIVILSQYDDPDYAISLLSEGAAGYAYLLKDRIAEGDQLARAIREVATGGSMLDPAIVGALVNPVRSAE